MAQTGGPHDSEFPVVDHFAVDKNNHREKRNWDNNGNEIGQQQGRQIEERARRKPSVDDHLDEPKRLAQPDDARQPGGHKNHAHQQLA